MVNVGGMVCRRTHHGPRKSINPSTFERFNLSLTSFQPFPAITSFLLAIPGYSPDGKGNFTLGEIGAPKSGEPSVFHLKGWIRTSRRLVPGPT